MYFNVLLYGTAKQVVKSIVFCMDLLSGSKRFHSGSSETSSTTLPVGVSLTFHNKNSELKLKSLISRQICIQMVVAAHHCEISLKIPDKFNFQSKQNLISYSQPD
jgi:hypothetical protein